MNLRIVVLAALITAGLVRAAPVMAQGDKAGVPMGKDKQGDKAGMY